MILCLSTVPLPDVQTLQPQEPIINKNNNYQKHVGRGLFGGK